jgi:hypothetical protein
VESLAAFAEMLQASSFGAWARGSAYAYPVANLVHLAGLVLLVGGIGLLDLRLAGFFRELPLAPLWKVLTPLGVAGLVLAPLSGAVMFAADAKALFGSEVFRLKLILIVLALLNALSYRRLWRRHLPDWDRSAPRVARALAVTSLMLWMTVGALGRLIAYS